jgi:hypothetical protein
VIGKPNGSSPEREQFSKEMETEPYRNTFFQTVRNLGPGYWIEVIGEQKAVDTFQTADALWEFTKSDDWRYYTFVITKNYAPGDPEISNENIAATLMKGADKLILLYRILKVKVG